MPVHQAEAAVQRFRTRDPADHHHYAGRSNEGEAKDHLRVILADIYQQHLSLAQASPQAVGAAVQKMVCQARALVSGVRVIRDGAHQRSPELRRSQCSRRSGCFSSTKETVSFWARKKSFSLL